MSRSFDHIVLASRDLDAHARLFESLGFRVGAVNRHPWGTVNRIIQLDGAFLELISTGPDFRPPQDLPAGQFSFAGFVHAFLAKREGMAMLAFATQNAQADQRLFRTDGIGDYETFHFERRGRKADGAPTQVAFTLAFASDPRAPDCGYFSCQHHFPENFWSEELRSHPNGALRLDAVIAVAEAPADHAQFLSHLTGQRDFRSSSLGVFFNNAETGGTLDVLTPVAAVQLYGESFGAGMQGPCALAGIRISGCNRLELAQRLSAQTIEFYQNANFLIVPPRQAMGAGLIFG